MLINNNLAQLEVFLMDTDHKKRARIPIGQKSRNRKLLRAAEAGDLTEVKEAIDDGANINTFKQENDDDASCQKSALILALENGHNDIAKYLIVEKGATVELGSMVYFHIENLKTQWLLEAATNGHFEDFIKIHKLCANKVSSDIHSKKSLWLASKNGHTDIEKYLIGNGHADLAKYVLGEKSNTFVAFSDSKTESNFSNAFGGGSPHNAQATTMEQELEKYKPLLNQWR